MLISQYPSLFSVDGDWVTVTPTQKVNYRFLRTGEQKEEESRTVGIVNSGGGEQNSRYS